MNLPTGKSGSLSRLPEPKPMGSPVGTPHKTRFPHLSPRAPRAAPLKGDATTAAPPGGGEEGTRVYEESLCSSSGGRETWEWPGRNRSE